MSNSYLTNDALQRAIKAVLPLISLYLPPGVGIAAWATKIIIDVLKKNPEIVSDVLLDGGLYFLVPALIGGVGFTSSGVLKGLQSNFTRTSSLVSHSGFYTHRVLRSLYTVHPLWWPDRGYLLCITAHRGHRNSLPSHGTRPWQYCLAECWVPLVDWTRTWRGR